MVGALDTAKDRGRDVVVRGTAAARGAVDRARGAATRARDLTIQTVRTLAESAGPELQQSLMRLRKVRKPSDAVDAFQQEVEHLLRVLAPVLVENPVPIRDPRVARAVVATLAAGAATAEEAEELTLLVSSGATAPGVPSVVALAFLSLAAEVHVAVSLRVHALEDAGLPVDPERVAHDVAAAMVGSKQLGGRMVITKAMVKKVTERVLRRWGTGLVPVIGIVYSAWDSQATIAAISSMPLTPPDPPELPAGETTPALSP